MILDWQSRTWLCSRECRINILSVISLNRLAKLILRVVSIEDFQEPIIKTILSVLAVLGVGF